MSTLQENPKLALLAIPGALFWILAGFGIAREDQTLIGAAVVLILATLVTAGIYSGIRSSREAKAKRRVWNEGVEAKARILSTRTNGHFNDHPRVIFQLEIHPDRGAPYPLELTTHISQLAIPRIQPEMEIAVRVDPNDPTNVVVDASLTPYGYE